MKDYRGKRKQLKNEKREAMKEEFNSSKERKAMVQSFKRESRSLKRSEKNAVKQELKDKYGI